MTMAKGATAAWETGSKAFWTGFASAKSLLVRDDQTRPTTPNGAGTSTEIHVSEEGIIAPQPGSPRTNGKIIEDEDPDIDQELVDDTRWGRGHLECCVGCVRLSPTPLLALGLTADNDRVLPSRELRRCGTR